MSEVKGSADGCLCYTTDINYALPTLLSASQARKHLSPRTDIVVIIVGASAAEVTILAQAHESEGVALVDVPCDAIDHLPIEFARYHLDRVLDPRYRRVAHVDGDTHVLGSLDPLLDVDVAPGRVIAAPDPVAFIAATSGLAWRSHRKRFADIGLSPEAASRYVNTGLFRGRREDLAGMGEACCTLALREGQRMRFGQQDAFNVALKSAIDLASIRWNYPAFFSNFRFDTLVEPRIRHFMSNPRPWQAPVPPWGQIGQAPYLDLVLRHPALAHLFPPLPNHRRLRYEIQQRVKRLAEPLLWDTPHVRNRIAEHEATAIV